MLFQSRNQPVEAMADPFEAIEFELAIDLEDPRAGGFEAAVRRAAASIGGELLFDMPCDGSIEDAARIAAVRVPDAKADRILFAVLDAAGTSIRVAARREVGDRFFGFARAFVGVLETLSPDRSFAGSRPLGSA